MPREIDRQEVSRLIEENAQLVEVLPASEYEEEHLPGAISIPLAKLDSQARDRLDPKRAIVVYCWDSA